MSKVIHSSWGKRGGTSLTRFLAPSPAHPAPDLSRAAWLAPTFPAHCRQCIVRGLGATDALPPAVAAAIETAIDRLVAVELDALQIAEPSFADINALQVLQAKADAQFGAWLSALSRCLSGIVATVPPVPAREGASLSIAMPLIDRLPDAAARVTEIVAAMLAFADDHLRPGAAVARRVKTNLLKVSGLTAEAAAKNPYRLKTPDGSGLAGSALVTAYLAGTPFAQLLATPLSLPLTPALRASHTHIVGGAGWGKTQLLQMTILADLSQRPERVPAIVVLDPHGDMIKTIARLACFAPGGHLAGRLVLIDAADVLYPPAINFFDTAASPRLARYDAAARIMIQNGVIEMFDYIFSALLDVEMVGKGRLSFRFLARLLLAIDGANLMTLKELLDERTGFDLYQANKHKLSASTCGFFDGQWFSDKSYKATRSQILRRLYTVLEQPSFEAMLGAPRNRVDFFDYLQTGKIVLVNAAVDVLKREQSAIFGRVIIAMVLAATLERAGLPEAERRPAYMLIDEAGSFFDSNIEDFLTQARKYNVGLTLAHQHVQQLTPPLRAAVAANTALKWVGGVSDTDARALAPDLHCAHEFIMAQTKQATSTSFAVYARGLTPHAISVAVPYGLLEQQPQMTQTQYDAFVAENRRRVCRDNAARDPAPRSTDPLSPRAIQRAGHLERVELVDDERMLDSRLDTGADMSVLYVETVDLRAAVAVFTVATGQGGRMTLEKPVLRSQEISGVVAGAATDCPVVALRIALAGTVIDEPVALLVGDDTPPLLLGKTFLAGNFSVDTSVTFLHTRNPGRHLHDDA